MFKVIWNVVKQIFGVVLWVLSPLKRAVCGRKRKNSDTILPLTGHYPSVEGLSSMNGTADVNILLLNTVKHVLSCQSKIDKTEILITNGSTNKGQKYCRMLASATRKEYLKFVFKANALSYHLSLRSLFCLLKTGFTVVYSLQVKRTP